MNAVTKIHLGRQAFTIALDAHRELVDYIESISKAVDDPEIDNEIELRMAELLAERGISGDKVVLLSDVKFLKAQLGNSSEFKDKDGGTSTAETELTSTKHLFRDTDNAMIAGVAAGLARYLGIDTLIVRLLFVVFVVITFGWGILLYVLLWLLVPEAKTSSEQLQMAGKPITVKSIKDTIHNADVKGAAKRVRLNLADPINKVFSILLKLVGLAFVIFGLSAIFGLIAAETYYLANSAAWLKGNIFPVGVREQLVMHIAAAVIALIAVFIVLFGIAIFRRKWPIRTWITGVLIGLILIGLAAGGALAADVYPNVRDRYNANTHTTLRSEPAFSAIDVSGEGLTFVNFQESTKYYVSLNYYGHPNLKAISTTVTNGVLLIDTSRFNWHRNCSTLCLPSDYRLSATVYAPNAVQLENQDIYLPPSAFINPIPVPPSKPFN